MFKRSQPGSPSPESVRITTTARPFWPCKNLPGAGCSPARVSALPWGLAPCPRFLPQEHSPCTPLRSSLVLGVNRPLWLQLIPLSSLRLSYQLGCAGTSPSGSPAWAWAKRTVCFGNALCPKAALDSSRSYLSKHSLSCSWLFCNYRQ